MRKLICRLIGHTRKLERRWCPYSVMRLTADFKTVIDPVGGKYHLYCKRCGRGVKVEN